MLHTVAIFIFLNYLFGRFDPETSSVEPIAHGELVNEEIVRRLTAELAKQPKPSGIAEPSMATAIEPGVGVVESIAQRILDYEPTEGGPDPLATVRRNAALLERISSPEEIDRMASKLREAMGASSLQLRRPTADTPPVDWPQAVPSGGKRIEVGERIEIHETFIDAAGGASTMIHAKEAAPNSEDFIYTIAMIERGQRDPPSRCTKDDFDLAAERIRPFEVIDQFPLLQELHRSAILPIMQKMSQDESANVPATQPTHVENPEPGAAERKSE